MTPDPPTQTTLVEREKHFYNARRLTRYDSLRALISRAIGQFGRYEDMEKLYDPRGKEVLDYGCGTGQAAIEIARRGARHVTGIDISDREIAEASALATRSGMAGRLRFLVADGHATEFPDGSFDLIIGRSILHHLQLEPALRELRRIMRPGGMGVFVEPLWHNPLLRLGRALTPSARTPDEHPLTAEDWELCAAVFPNFWHYEREFLTIPLMPLNLLLPRRQQSRLAQRVGQLDDKVLARFPTMRKYARLTFLVLQ